MWPRSHQCNNNFVVLLESLREQLWKGLCVPELLNRQNVLNPTNGKPQALMRQVSNSY